MNDFDFLHQGLRIVFISHGIFMDLGFIGKRKLLFHN